MDQRVQGTIDYLERTGFRAVSCRLLAARVGLSVSRFAHLFKQETGISLRSYVMLRRLYHAAELMLTTERRVSEIWYEVGFTDFANFDHSFKRAFALSPREYRERWQAQNASQRGRLADRRQGEEPDRSA